MAVDAAREPIAAELEVDAEVVGEQRGARVCSLPLSTKAKKAVGWSTVNGHGGRPEDLAATSRCLDRGVGVGPPVGWELDLSQPDPERLVGARARGR